MIIIMVLFIVVFGGLVILDIIAKVYKQVRVIRNVPVTWHGREYRNVTPREPREPREPRASRAREPREPCGDTELVARAFTSPTLPFAEHKRMLELGFAREKGQWVKR